MVQRNTASSSPPSTNVLFHFVPTPCSKIECLCLSLTHIHVLHYYSSCALLMRTCSYPHRVEEAILVQEVDHEILGITSMVVVEPNIALLGTEYGWFYIMGNRIRVVLHNGESNKT
ncbi:hypothetical protein VIGAN_01285900 [Vigna angularis var. angularis]|uniref:Uncharacterized protein n=1 Tax=Vigna angularis var. angularis TaxID=157739 RepID=A0A0S3R357_PHAAN|nr:hypothetical protein VIGAN_01285900 [Vigna angularis var. angularis]